MTCADHYHCRAWHSVQVALQDGGGASSSQAVYVMGTCSAHRMACADPSKITSTLPCPTCSESWIEMEAEVDQRRVDLRERTAGRRFYRAYAKHVRYVVVVAVNAAHAVTILRTSGAEIDIDNLTWLELDAVAADRIMPVDDEGDGTRRPLTAYAPGAWFCSEY